MTTDQTVRNTRLVEAFIQELFSEGDLDAVDRYVERWGRLDELGMLRQLGVIPG